MSETFRSGRRALALSHWHAGTLRPWEAGVYERPTASGRYACWSGRAWMREAATPEQAARQTDLTANSGAAWRGLAAPSGLRCATCRDRSVVDAGVDPESGNDLIRECPDC